MDNYELLYYDIFKIEPALDSMDLVKSIDCMMRKLDYVIPTKNGSATDRMSLAIQSYYKLDRGVVDSFKPIPITDKECSDLAKSFKCSPMRTLDKVSVEKYRTDGQINYEESYVKLMTCLILPWTTLYYQEIVLS